jgi:hypothetical protein
MSRTTTPNPKFTVRLNSDDWEQGLNAWRCPALAIPKAEVENVYLITTGKHVDKDNYVVMKSPPVIRWGGGKPPIEVTVLISLTEELSPESETDRWRKNAIIFPFVSAIIVAIIGAVATYLTKTDVDSIKKETSTIRATAEGYNISNKVFAHFNDWDIDRGAWNVPFRLTVEPVDHSKFVVNTETSKYDLVVAVRQKKQTQIDEVGEYENAWKYAFQNIYTRTSMPIEGELLKAVKNDANLCLELVLFRIAHADYLDKPFAPKNHPDAKVLQFEYTGQCPP